MLRRLASLVLCCAPFYLHAFERPDPARLGQLADSAYWIALGHYEARTLGGWRSYVDDDAFFLAKDGAHDPEAELRATLEALYAPANLGDRHAQCVYPARTRWLREQLQLTDLPHVECEEFTRWYEDVAPYSTTLCFRRPT